MKYTHSIAVAGALVLLTGCASSPPVVVLTPVGPAPAGQAMTSGQGYLQVYSARFKEPVAPNFMEWQTDYDFTAAPFLYDLAHSDYVIRTQEGNILKNVRNARNPADPDPALVALPPGRYKIEAEGEEAGGRTVRVDLPVLIEPGETTVVHLSGNWKPRAQFTDADVVRLPDGQIAGWLARQ
jgi:hypothetical protein